MIDSGKLFEKMMHAAVNKGLIVKFAPLKYNNGLLKGERVALRQDMDIDQINYVLAYEIAHAYLHCDKGDTINSPDHDMYEEQADRAAHMLLDVLSA